MAEHYILVVSHTVKDIWYYLFKDEHAARVYKKTEGWFEPVSDTVLRYKQKNPGTLPWLDGLGKDEIEAFDDLADIFKPRHEFYSTRDLCEFMARGDSVIDREIDYISV